MYVSRRRNLRHGGGILLSVEAMDIDAVHPIGSLLFSADKNYNPNNDTHLQGTTWAQIYYNGAIASTTYPNLVGYSTGENVATGHITWENLPEHTIVSTGTTDTVADHSHSVNIDTTDNGAHNHEVKHQGYYNCDSGKERQPASTGIIYSDPLETFAWSEWVGNHRHNVNGNTGSSGGHSHTVSTTAIEGGYVDSHDEYHSEGKQVRLTLDPSKYNVFVWKRIQ